MAMLRAVVLERWVVYKGFVDLRASSGLQFCLAGSIVLFTLALF